MLARITTNNGSIFAWNEAHDTILLVQAVPADLMPVVAAETTLTYSGEEQTVLTVPEGATLLLPCPVGTRPRMWASIPLPCA